MSTDLSPLAARLLDAQVAHLVGQLNRDDAAALVTSDLLSLLDALGDATVSDVLDADKLRDTVLVLLQAVAGAPVRSAILPILLPVLLELDANNEHRLGDIVDRNAVEAGLDVLLGSAELREEVLRRLGRSPAMSALALRFMTALVGDAVQQNRERAEKLPGVKSMFSVGDFAARQANRMTPKPLEKLVGGAADKGAQVAMERMSRALVDTFDEGAVRSAAMEVWDLHADDTIRGLSAYLTADEVSRLLNSGQDVILHASSTAWFESVIDAAVATFLGTFGDQKVSDVMTGFGLDRYTVALEIERHLPQILASVDQDVLGELLRRRLGDFYSSDEAQRILGDL